MTTHNQQEQPAGWSRRRFVGVGAGTVAAAAAAAMSTPHVAAASADDEASADAAARVRRDVGFVLSHEQFPGPALVDIGARAARHGFRYAWTSDHFQPWQDNEGHSTFPWLTLAALGMQTSSLRIGTGVTCPTYRHHPTEVAQAFASLGIFFPGRVFLGVGTGEALNEHAATGQFGNYDERAARLVEAITLIRELWTGERISFDGTYYTTVDARLYDLPAQPVPIYVAAAGLKSAYLAGRHGDGWVTSAADFARPELVAQFEAGARDAGRDPSTMPKFAETFVVVGGAEAVAESAELWRFTVDPWTDLVYETNPVDIQRIAEQRWTLDEVAADWPKGLDPAPHIEALQTILDAGGTPFVHSGQADQAKVIHFYGNQVLPELH